MFIRSFSLILSCLVGFIAAQPLLACSVCFAAKKENLMAFLGTGVLLSLLPLALVSGVGWWLYRQAQRQQAFFVQAEADAKAGDKLSETEK